jgi:hypothetical protein
MLMYFYQVTRALFNTAFKLWSLPGYFSRAKPRFTPVKVLPLHLCNIRAISGVAENHARPGLAMRQGNPEAMIHAAPLCGYRRNYPWRLIGGFQASPLQGDSRLQQSSDVQL